MREYVINLTKHVVIPKLCTGQSEMLIALGYLIGCAQIMYTAVAVSAPDVTAHKNQKLDVRGDEMIVAIFRNRDSRPMAR